MLTAMRMSVAFDTPPPPMPVRADGAGAGRRSGRPSLLARGSSFLGVYQAVPELSSAEEARRAERGYWQHRHSAALVCLSCTLGYGSVCRFALFGGVYGVAFLVQFLVLSLVVGLPLLTLNMTLGQYIGAGAIDMWNISPVFKGIGLAAVFAEFVLGVYTIVPTAWSFVYLRDSFVSSYNHYKWAECAGNCSGGYLQQLTQTVPAYFNSRVLHRNMSETGRPDVGYLGFEISFNLAVIWIIIYICLGRGLRSYGKIVYISTMLSIISFVIVCIQLLSWTEGLGEFFTDKVLFDNVFWNTVPWVVAARETFMVWGLHGVAVMAAASHCRFSHRLRRDTTLVALVTLVVLFLSALFGFACLRSLRHEQSGYVVSTSSFETAVSSRFLSVPGDGGGEGGLDSSDGGDLAPPPLEMLHYSNLVSGVIIRNTRDPRQDDWTSGYQVHRLATELFPSLLSAVGGSGISSFWALIFYLSLILFGLGQQLAIWRSVVEAVISVYPSKLQSWELTVTLIMCLLGFACSLPLMTQVGIHIIFFLDYCIGSLWWLIIINVLQLLALFYVRGSPFASTQVVTILISGNNCMTNWAGPFLSFIWHVILPMALLVLSVVSFRLGGFGGIFSWSADNGYAYWGLWTRQLGSMMMLFPLLLVPVTGLVQAIRHVRSGRGDLFDRIQSLYRPEYSETILGPIGLTVGVPEGDLRNSPHLHPRYTDPPPKYTPPPSYSTATGARLAKMLRQSMRRSVRRLRETLGTGDSSGSLEAAVAASSPSAVEAGAVSSPQRRPQGPPPSYASVLLESLPGALRRSVRRLSVRMGRLPAASVDEDALLARRTAELTEPPSIGARHKRSVSLDQQRCDDWSPDCAVLPAVSGLAGGPHVSRSLPRALTSEQVRQLLRSAVGTRRHTTDTVTDGRRIRTRRSGSATVRSDPVVHRPGGPESLA